MSVACTSTGWGRMMTVMVPVWIRCILEERPTSGILCTRWVPPSCFRCLYTLSPAILTAAWCKPPERDKSVSVDTARKQQEELLETTDMINLMWLYYSQWEKKCFLSFSSGVFLLYISHRLKYNWHCHNIWLTIFSRCVVQNLKVPVLVPGEPLVHVEHLSGELLTDVTWNHTNRW